jgi:hypothetical protein
MLDGAMPRERNFLGYWRGMVGEQQPRPVDFIQAEEALDEVGLRPLAFLPRGPRPIADHHPTWTAGPDFAIEIGRNAGGG